MYWRDIVHCIQTIGCDGFMAAEGNLYNPYIFAPSFIRTNWLEPMSLEDKDGLDKIQKILMRFQFNPYIANLSEEFNALIVSGSYPLFCEHPPAHYAALEFLYTCQKLCDSKELIAINPDSSSLINNRRVNGITASSIRGHLFKILRLPLSMHVDMRDLLAKKSGIAEFINIVLELSRRIEKYVLDLKNQPDGLKELSLLKNTIDLRENQGPLFTNGEDKMCNLGKWVDRIPEGTFVIGGWRELPFWVSQPYVRSENNETSANENKTQECPQKIEDRMNRKKRKIESRMKFLKNNGIDIVYNSFIHRNFIKRHKKAIMQII